MKVKFIKYHVMFAHDVNDVCELTDEDGERLIESGHVVHASSSEATGEDPIETLASELDIEDIDVEIDNEGQFVVEDDNQEISAQEVIEEKKKPGRKPAKK